MGHLTKKDNTEVNTVLNTGVDTRVNTGLSSFYQVKYCHSYYHYKKKKHCMNENKLKLACTNCTML